MTSAILGNLRGFHTRTPLMKTRSSTKSSSRRSGARRSSSVKLSTATRKKTGGKASRAKGRSKSSTGRASTAKPSGRTSRSARTTTDHDTIRQWVESHGGHPAVVERTTKDDEPSGILRIDFPGFSGEQTLTEISWDRWFEIFDERGLAFLYQDTRLRNGQPSRFNKIVTRGK